jgi:hypothetical protein
MEITQVLFDKIQSQKDRLLDIPGVNGFRDIGGGAIKKGVVYRSGDIGDIEEAGKDIVINKLHIKTELDLRGSGMGSVLHSYLCDYHFDCPEYVGEDFGGIDCKEEIVKDNIADIFTHLSEKQDQPFLVHCEIGRDRAGTICFLLESLLGESEEDIIIDYGLSFFVKRAYPIQIYRFYEESFHPLMDYIKGYKGANDYQKGAKAFLLDCGLSEATLDKICRNLS